jgi:hypothetical protein
MVGRAISERQSMLANTHVQFDESRNSSHSLRDSGGELICKVPAAQPSIVCGHESALHAPPASSQASSCSLSLDALDDDALLDPDQELEVNMDDYEGLDALRASIMSNHNTERDTMEAGPNAFRQQQPDALAGGSARTSQQSDAGSQVLRKSNSAISLAGMVGAGMLGVSGTDLVSRALQRSGCSGLCWWQPAMLVGDEIHVLHERY